MSITSIGPNHFKFSTASDGDKREEEIIADVQETILSYLSPKEILQSEDSQELNDIGWRKLCEEACELPADAPTADANGTYYKDLYKKIFESAFTGDAYLEYFGGFPKVTIPKIDMNITQKIMSLSEDELNDWRLILIPTHLDIQADAKSPFALDENGTLIQSSSSSSNETATMLKVPVTLNNIHFLFTNCLKKGGSIGFSDETDGEEILKEHGNAALAHSYWSYQKKELLGQHYWGRAYEGPNGQEQLAKGKGFEVSPLIDRVLFNFLTFVSSGEYLDGAYPNYTKWARTSTAILTKNNTLWQTSCGSSANRILYLFEMGDFGSVGVAVRIPCGKPRLIGS